jgi:hypothetical protein
MANQRHTMKVNRIAGNGDILNLTFATRKAAMEAYRTMDPRLSCSFPARENHAVYSDPTEAAKSAASFFNV